MWNSVDHLPLSDAYPQLLGDTLNIPGFYILHDILTTAMCIAWVILIICTGIAFYRRDIFYEGDAITNTAGAGSTGMKGRQTAEVLADNDEKNRDVEAGRSIRGPKRARTMGASFEGQPEDLDPTPDAGGEKEGGHDREPTGLSKRTLVAAEGGPSR